jgi:hypothetical protein
MGTSAISSASSPGAPDRTTQSDVAVQALVKTLRIRKEEAETLIRLVEEATASGDKGRHVNYYG